MNLPEDIRNAASEKKKLIYLYLERVGNASLDELGENLGMKKLELHPILSSLLKAGYIERLEESSTRFRLAS